MLIVTPIVVNKFGGIPADAKARTIASMIRIAPRPISAPSIFEFRVPSSKFRVSDSNPELGTRNSELFLFVYRLQPADLKIPPAGRCFYFYFIAFFSAHQSLTDWRDCRDLAVIRIAFLGGDEFVCNFLVAVGIKQHDRRSICHAVGRDLGQIDLLDLGQSLVHLSSCAPAPLFGVPLPPYILHFRSGRRIRVPFGFPLESGMQFFLKFVKFVF